MVKVLRKFVVGVQVEDEEDMRQKVEEIWTGMGWLGVGLFFWAEDKRKDVWRGKVTVRCLPNVAVGKGKGKGMDMDMEGRVVVSEMVRLRGGLPGMYLPCTSPLTDDDQQMRNYRYNRVVKK